MAIPGDIHNPNTRGCHHLVQQGARLVTSVSDILEELNLEKRSCDLKPDEGLAKLPLAIKGKSLVDCLGIEITTLNEVIVKSGLSFEEVACQLATLELSGIIKAVPGGYMRCNL